MRGYRGTIRGLALVGLTGAIVFGLMALQPLPAEAGKKNKAPPPTPTPTPTRSAAVSVLSTCGSVPAYAEHRPNNTSFNLTPGRPTLAPLFAGDKSWRPYYQ